MKRLFLKGNEAIAEAAVLAGCRFFAGYPITPQNEIPEYLSRRLPEVGGSFVQGESEVASINMVYGAAATGTRCMTSSSGPGLSLKSEGLSYFAGSELPAVIVNVMRGGPGLGSIQAAQMDYLQATKASGHGGFKMLVYAPSTVQEAIDLTYLAFDKADEYRTPVLVLADGCIGSMMEPVVLPEAREAKRVKRTFSPAVFNGLKRTLITSLMISEEQQEKLNKQQAATYASWTGKEERVEEFMLEDAEYVIAAYGTSARISRTAILALREQGVKVGMVRPITLNPYPYASFEKLRPDRVKAVLCVEMSIPDQMTEDIRLGLDRGIPLHTLGHSGGIMLYDDEIIAAVNALAGKGEA